MFFMKKWIAAVFIVVILFISGIYIFIPSRLTFTKSIAINVPVEIAFRYLADEKKWALWSQETDAGYNGYRYSIKKVLFNAIETEIAGNGSVIHSSVRLQPLKSDSVLIEWKYLLAAGSSPLDRIREYRNAVEMSKISDSLLIRFQHFIENKENVYGRNIIKSTFTDSILISSKQVFNHTPSTGEIYKLVQILQNYIAQQHAKQVGAPMLNITKTDSVHVQAMVAIPTDKILPGNKEFSYKKMVPGNFLVTEIQGGEGAVSAALSQLLTYTEDYKRTVMAIPFQILLTDRSSEKDTLKWITRIYMPVE
jgi:effector-binding domain-containing protein